MLKIRAQNAPWYGGIQLLIIDEDPDGSYGVAQPLVFERREDPSLSPIPDSSIPLMGGKEAQQLMDELWQCGIRPTEGMGSAGSLRATENHLADMRKIVFKKLSIEE